MRRLLLIVAVGLLGCSRPALSIRELEGMGFTNIVITGYERRSCTDDDDFRTGFVAERGGKLWKGQVCKNVFESEATVKFEEMDEKSREE